MTVLTSCWYPWHTHAMHEGIDGNDMYARIHSTTRGEYVHYTFATDYTDDLGAKRVRLINTNSFDAWPAYLPGYFEHGAHVDDAPDGSGGSGKRVEAVCLVSGTPVTEFVNTVYIQGYHHNMVPGIFAKGYGDGYRDVINWSDCFLAKNDFDDFYKELSIFDVTGDEHTKARRAPLKAVMTEQANGLSTMMKICGKWGVHPRFKEGGYGMAAYPAADPESSSIHACWENRAGRNEIIHSKDIEGAEISGQNPQMRNSYSKITYVSKAPDIDAVTTESERTIATARPGRKWMRDAPQLWDLKVNTSDCAEGSKDSTAFRYYRYVKNIFNTVYNRSHYSCTLRLSGLKHAGLAPGDWVDIQTLRQGDSHIRNADWGPHQTYVSYSQSILTTIKEVSAGDSTVSGSVSRINKPWFVTSSHVDWINGLVTVKLTRYNETDKDLHGVHWVSGLDPVAERDESRDMGMPIFKKSGH